MKLCAVYTRRTQIMDEYKKKRKIKHKTESDMKISFCCFLIGQGVCANQDDCKKKLFRKLCLAGIFYGLLWIYDWDADLCNEKNHAKMSIEEKSRSHWLVLLCVSEIEK